MKRFTTGDSIDICVTRLEANFDRACDSAYRQALDCFHIDENWHTDIVQGWESDSTVVVSFVSYKRICNEHVYSFTATIPEDGSF